MAEQSNEKPGNPAEKKAGFATIIGRPNVGKSTLMNRMIGQKIAITSYKPQTTRTKIRTIYTGPEGQIVFLDTPGIHESRTKLGAYMVKAAKGTLKEVDVILWLVEPRASLTQEDRAIIEMLAEVRTPVIVVINKIDKVKKAEILPVIDLYARAGSFHGIIPVSARTGDGVDALMEEVFRLLPVGEPFYEEDMVTTQTEREIAGEIIREKALRLLQEEVPHGIAVTIESMKMRSRKGKGEICDIDASIICEREGHKRIVIGKGGEMLRKIGTDARKDIENMLQCQVNLKLWVKVRRDWKDDDTQMRSFGYDERKL
ncbi:MAG: GTPase Era [Eubacteriales bacterium]|nr:GTPase Era [Eubacteriales bacterium]